MEQLMGFPRMFILDSLRPFVLVLSIHNTAGYMAGYGVFKLCSLCREEKIWHTNHII